MNTDLGQHPLHFSLSKHDKIAFLIDANSSEHLSINLCVNLRIVCLAQLLEIYFAFVFNRID